MSDHPSEEKQAHDVLAQFAANEVERITPAQAVVELQKLLLSNQSRMINFQKALNHGPGAMDMLKIISEQNKAVEYAAAIAKSVNEDETTDVNKAA